MDIYCSLLQEMILLFKRITKCSGQMQKLDLFFDIKQDDKVKLYIFYIFFLSTLRNVKRIFNYSLIGM